MFNKKYSAHTLAQTTSGTLNRLKTSRTVKRRKKKKLKKENRKDLLIKKSNKDKNSLEHILRVDLFETF